MRRKPAAPGDLGPIGRKLWNSVVAVYDLAPAEVETLRQAARTCDLIWALSGELLDQPAMIRGSVGQMKLNPIVAAVADQRRLLDGLLRSMNLPMPEEDEGRRRSAQQQVAAQARWRQETERKRHSQEAAGG